MGFEWDDSKIYNVTLYNYINLWIYPQVIKHGHENNNHLVR